MDKPSNHPLITSDPGFDQSVLADTTRTEHRDDRSEVFYTTYQKIDPSKPAGKTAFPKEQLVIALTGLGHRGTGHATVHEMAVKRKHVVFTCDRERQRAIHAAKEIVRAGGKIHFVEADISTEAGVKRFMDEIRQRAGRLDVLVCNAGWAGDPKRDNIRDLSLQQYRELIDANLTSAILSTQAALTFFERQKSGAVVFLGTHNGRPGNAFMNQLVYGMGKTALSSLVGHLVLHYGGWLRVALVRVGPVRTDSENWKERLEFDPRWEDIEGSILNPTGRLTRPKEVARLIAWLTLDAPEHLTGVEINLDGGFGAVGLNIGTDGRESIVKLGRLLDDDQEGEPRAA